MIPPLTEPLENIGQIARQLNDLHNGNARLLLAAHALGGLCANDVTWEYSTFVEIAQIATKVADATLAALNEK